MQKRKGEEPVTVEECNDIDMVNLTGSAGIHDFVTKYSIGPKVVDVGAGLGASCRLLHVKYGIEPVGIEYSQESVDCGNRISRFLNLPEFLRQGDAMDPLGVENMDAAICYNMHYIIPKDKKVQVLVNIKDALKPGGLLWFEDISYARPFEEWHPDH
jgi:SAM-dependent methyltransferase